MRYQVHYEGTGQCAGKRRLPPYRTLSPHTIWRRIWNEPIAKAAWIAGCACIVYMAPKVLVIDEVGYLPTDNLGTTILLPIDQCSVRAKQGGICGCLRGRNAVRNHREDELNNAIIHSLSKEEAGPNPKRFASQPDPAGAAKGVSPGIRV
jgi:hypothetical protein